MEEKVLTKEEKEKLRKERQKRRKYRLLILLLLMLGTGTMLATSTYAWFTSNKNVSVETLKRCSSKCCFKKWYSNIC